MSEWFQLIPTTKGEFLLWGMLIALIFYYFEPQLKNIKNNLTRLRGSENGK